ncbi:MAG: hypothetical protein NZZ41_06755 [Candidatus Dojkabacteria bacterium]|nr:hypothetical protein [Candidatus Dojkabacteria bacterium]
MLLLVLLLLSCFIVVSIGLFSAWLYTYRVFTQRTLIGEIEVSEIKIDENYNQYFELTYKQYKKQNALETWILGNRNEESNQIEYEKSFKIYGDQFWIGGPIIKFHDGLILLNFQTIYKIGEIGGKYTDLEKEKQKTIDKFSVFALNNGYEDWKEIQNDLQSENFKSKIYNLLIDSMQLTSAGKFVNNMPQKYILYITNTGFFLDEK